jgi:hypothetical protein
MKRENVLRAAAAAAALAAFGAAARAEDPAADAEAPEKPKVEGDVRTGVRFLSGEGDGRFQQDVGYEDGPRLFSANLLATQLGGKTPIDEAEVHLDGVGDRNSDYLMSVRKRDLLDVSGGYRRDDSVFTSSGDVFPFDTLRERGFVHIDLKPSRILSFRVAWDRNKETGDADQGGFSNILQTPPTGSGLTYHQALPQSLRSTWSSDDFMVGANWSPGIFRFGFTQTIRLARTEDDTSIHVVESGEPLHEDVDQSTRHRTYATTGKAGVSLGGGKLDVTLFVTYLETPLESRADGTTHGLDPDGNPIDGAFHAESDLRKKDLVWRLESAWRPHPDWELSASGERGSLVTDETVDLNGSATFAQDVRRDYRITDDITRWSGDVTWDVTRQIRLRAGEQYLYEDYFDPTNSHFAELEGTSFSSASWRTTLGAEWTSKSKVWSLAATGHHTTNDEPHTTAVPDFANDWTVRARWRPESEFSGTLVWRHVATNQTGRVSYESLGQFPDPNFGDRPGDTTDLGSATRADTFSGSLAWTCDPWTVTGTASVRTFDTTSDTAYGQLVNARDPNDPAATTFRRILETVGFRGNDVVANLDVRYAVTKTLRAFTNLSGTDTTGDYTARWLAGTLGAEYDLCEDLTLGASVSAWRLRQQPSGGDNYRTYGTEVWLTWRF